MGLQKRVNMSPSPPPQALLSKDSPPPIKSHNLDYIIILAALLFAVICVLGLTIVVRCYWIRRITSRTVVALPAPSTSANKGLKKKVLSNGSDWAAAVVAY
ncbi:RING-H2 finger ATL80 [Olea europaea subsp. europaea]|uniref:RING-H2 finger ATL80 n=1 Tax=Olea europaea subsp. europaea TaxID=158383 RepID=A0A8S0V3U9_OLEEU|nr:RING-H2 finger ATL80 [Olea europaea subsp. europaea]